MNMFPPKTSGRACPPSPCLVGTKNTRQAREWCVSGERKRDDSNVRGYARRNITRVRSAWVWPDVSEADNDTLWGSCLEVEQHGTSELDNDTRGSWWQCGCPMLGDAMAQSK
jgi:hypothetical protein